MKLYVAMDLLKKHATVYAGFYPSSMMVECCEVVLAEIERLQKWAAYCHCCAASGEFPGTREEFEARESAEKKEK